MSLIQDKASLEWLRVKEYCETRLAELRAENDADLGESETANVRGQIKFCQEVLGLASEDPPVRVVDNTYLG